MKIKVDTREKALYQLLAPLCKDLSLNMKIMSETLPVGDIIIMDDEEELLVIERKTLKDLAGSIKDGRYEEQSYRLNNIKTHNHNIMYLIEGDFNFYNEKYMRIPKKTLYSAIFCLQYYKGFSLMRTSHIAETAEYILRLTDKMMREKDSHGYYNGGDQHPVKNYCTVAKRVKKNNLTFENIGGIILSQIPGISSVTSLAIMKKYRSLFDLLGALKKNPQCLDDFVYLTKKGTKRHLSKTCTENIVKFLLYPKKQEAKVDI